MRRPPLPRFSAAAATGSTGISDRSLEKAIQSGSRKSLIQRMTSHPQKPASTSRPHDRSTVMPAAMPTSSTADGSSVLIDLHLPEARRGTSPFDLAPVVQITVPAGRIRRRSRCRGSGCRQRLIGQSPSHG